MSQNRPNILWLTYEDTSPQFVSCYGHTPVSTTPMIDSLAEQGVRFDNAFASAPVCSASRTAIITGCCNQATGLGHHRSKYPIPREQIRGFPTYLQQAGYYTTNNSKTDYNIEDERAYIDRTWDESSEQAHWRNRSAEQPFFSVFNYASSHQSRTMTHPWLWYKEHVLDKLEPEERFTPEQVDMPPIYRDTPEMRRHMSRVYNSLRLYDKEMNRRIEELREDGLLEDTIIFCFSDHGEGMPRGKCNGIGFGYRAAFVLWLPEKYKHLSPWGTQTITDELISFEDLAPTILSIVGLDAPDQMTGRAFLGDKRRTPPPYIYAARDRLDDTPDLCRSSMDGRFVYTRNFFPHLPVMKYQKYADVSEIQREIRKDYSQGALNEVQAELVNPTRPREYLFDLKSDPWEINNLADSPDYQEDLERLRNATLQHIFDVRDVMFLPEADMVENARNATPYEMRHNQEYNPLDGMIKVASLVGDFNDNALCNQLNQLNHEHSALRYWAAVGIFAARHNVAPHVDTLREHLNDNAPYVQAEIAAALYSATRDAKAKDVLDALIQSDEGLIAHQAVEKVLYMPEVAADFTEAVTLARKSLAVKERHFKPLREAISMYEYLYSDQPLFLEAMSDYLSQEDKAPLNQ